VIGAPDSSTGGTARAGALPLGLARRERRLGAPSPVVLIVLLAALAISLAPAFYMLSVSLMDNPQLFAGRVVPWPVRPENYPQAWVASDIGRLYGNSIAVSTLSMVITVAISALGGYGLGRIRFAGRGVVYALVLVGLTIPLQIALIPLFINLRSLGLLNTRLALIGPYTGFGLAFGTYIMKGFFEGLPRELEEAARLDGASEFGIFARVMLPLTRPALATVAIFLFLQNWNEFLFALTFITEGRMRTLPTGIYALLSSEFYGNYPILAASLVLFSVPVLILYFLFQQQFIEGLTAGALKH
jgi:raffinose/stachyose/melibiose transport system permease protein